MKRLLSLLLALLLFALTGCANGGTWDDRTYLKLYYPAPLDSAQGGDAIAHVNIAWDDMSQEDTQTQAERVLMLLMGECEEDGFTVPVPRGTLLRHCRVENGVAHVDFSEAYGTLSGMKLTVADYCVALSLTQITGVEQVAITVDGQELAYRDSQRFRARDVLFTDTDEPVRTLTTWLYFPNGQGHLIAERRELTLHEGQVRCGVVMDALMEGPAGETLLPLLPEGFAVLTVRLDEGTCYLNLPSSDTELLPDGEAAQQLLMQGIVNSLCAVSGVRQVQILQDGTILARFGLIDVSQPLQPSQ